MAVQAKAGRVARKAAVVNKDEDGNLIPGPLGVVSHAEIRELFRVAAVTTHQWRLRDQFPEPDDTVSGLPVWRVETVCRWGAQTGRPFYLTKSWVERLGL